MNIEYQSEKPRIHILLKSIKVYFKTILSNFVKRDLIHNSSLEQFLIDETVFDDVEKIYLGPKAALVLSEGNIPVHKINEVKKVCRNYYIELCKQISKRIDFGDKTLTALQILDPENLGESLIPLISIFPNLVLNNDIEELECQWRELLNNNIIPRSLDLEDYWSAVFKLKNGLNDSICLTN